MTDFIRITRGDNPYQREVQGKANESITVAALLDIVPTNRMRDVTDAAHGVVPNSVAEAALETFVEFRHRDLAVASD